MDDDYLDMGVLWFVVKPTNESEPFITRHIEKRMDHQWFMIPYPPGIWDEEQMFALWNSGEITPDMLGFI